MKNACKEILWKMLYVCACVVPHKPRCSVLLYHSISKTKDFFAVSPEVFRKQMEYMKSHANVLTLHGVLAFLSGTKLVRNSVAITFDDGYRDFAYEALPILKELEIPATVFVLGDTVDRDALGNNQPLLTSEDVSLLRDSDITIGSHGQTHRKLTKISLSEATNEIHSSRTDIERVYGITPEYLAYPKGSWSPEVAEIVKGAGYSAAFTVIETSVPLSVNPYAIPRIQIDSSTTFSQFKAKLTPAADWYYRLWLLFRKGR